MSLEESLEGVILCSMNLLPKKIASMMLFALVLCLFDSNTLARNKLMALLAQVAFPILVGTQDNICLIQATHFLERNLESGEFPLELKAWIK